MRSQREITIGFILAIACVVASIVSAPAFGCTFNVQSTTDSRGRTFLNWERPAGSTNFEVFVRTWYSGYMFVTSTRTSTLNLRAMTTDEQQHEYLIISHNDNDDPAARCLGQAKVILNGNKDLGAITEKRIVPLAGSVRGANGSDFHTSLTISFAALRSGRIVFRPTGTVASDSDPFLRYAFGDNDEPGPSEFYWDDVVAAMGASGTGSLEIIPDPVGDETALHVPNVSARVYNVAQNGTFGSDAEAVRPAEWFLNPVTQHSGAGIFVPAAHGNVRRNIGFRTLTEVSYEITLFAPGGKARHFSGSAPANFTYFSSLDAFVGQPVAANEQVHVSFSNGYAIGFYTVTDNVTNDPAMIVQSPAALEDSVSWGYR